MTTWNRSYSLYINVARPGGLACLLDGNTGNALSIKPAFMQGDIIPLRAHPRTITGVVGSTSVPVQFDSGVAIVMAAKVSNLSGDELFQVSDWTEVTPEGDVYYAGDLNLTSAAIATALAAATSVEVLVDFEVSSAAGEPLTYRFSATIYREAHAAGAAAPFPVAGAAQRWEEITIDGALCIRIKNSDGETVAIFKPAGA